MKPDSHRIQFLYLILLFLYTLAASLIWGVNTLFLLEAGLSNAQAFLANAFFTVGQVVFEVPTGALADVKGRRLSYLLGTITLSAATLLYVGAWQVRAPFWAWAVTSILLGLGYTFFSGATEAWLVDALKASGFKGGLDGVFAKGQSVGGVAMLMGSVGGGILAQYTNLGVPYVLRAAILGVTAVIAFFFMKDLGFKPRKSANPLKDVEHVLKTSAKFGWHKQSVRWMMLVSPFLTGVGFYTFYAMQPHLLQLYGDAKAYSVAGLAAAIVAAAQICGGFVVPQIRRYFKSRTSLLFLASLVASGALILIGFTQNFWIAIGLLSVWGLVSAIIGPVRQAYLNGLIPTNQRATVLSFDSLLGSSGGVFIQPGLGRVADLSGYAASFMVGGLVQVAALPFVVMAKLQKPRSDTIR